MKRLLPLLAGAAFLSACQDLPQEISAPELDAPAPAMAKAGAIPGHYVVVLERDANPRAVAAVAGVEPRYVYEHALTGFSAELNDGQLRALEALGEVRYIEPDMEVHAVGTQSGATWGLDRTDQRDLPLDDSYTYNNDGSSVHAYIIDTGIRTTHSDFGGRAIHGYDAVDGDSDATDCNGHGTHVAGTVGGTQWGMAKGATLVAVRVLDCEGSGTTSGVIAGVDWVTANHVQPAVSNMSLGGGASTALDDAVRNSIAAGVTYAIAAGNGDFIGRPQDACDGSPSRVTEAVTVGATDSTDTEASFSNYGTCVDILAPGVDITSAWYESDTQTNTISGTSMAAPHVAGAAALYLHANPSATPADIETALESNASANKINLHSSSESGGTPNLLLYTAFIGGGGGTTNSPPAASFTHSCSDLTCDFTDTSTDSDGTIQSWSWDFGDGSTSTAQHPSHSYAADGTYTVTLAVTDDAGATDSHSSDVSVQAPSSGGITLSTSGWKNKGQHQIDLSWDGATSTEVDVYRNGTVVATTANDGAYTDATSNRGGNATYTHKVCEAGTTTCSNESTTVF